MIWSFLFGSTKEVITYVAAKVACPHKSISIFGVNHLSLYCSFSLTTNAVSESLFSIAIFIINSSGNHFSIKQMAAGFPEKSLSVNVFTMYCLIFFIEEVSYFKFINHLLKPFIEFTYVIAVNDFMVCINGHAE